MRVRLSGDFCVYCGETADTVEHWPPKSLTSTGYLFPCCRECNSLLTNESGFYWSDRVNLLKAKLSLRYKNELNSPKWDNSELSSLGRNLKSKVMPKELLRRKIANRLKWDCYLYLTEIDPSGYLIKFMQTDTKIDEDYIEYVKPKKITYKKLCDVCGKGITNESKSRCGKHTRTK